MKLISALTTTLFAGILPATGVLVGTDVGAPVGAGDGDGVGVFAGDEDGEGFPPPGLFVGFGIGALLPPPPPPHAASIAHNKKSGTAIREFFIRSTL